MFRSKRIRLTSSTTTPSATSSMATPSPANGSQNSHSTTMPSKYIEESCRPTHVHHNSRRRCGRNMSTEAGDVEAVPEKEPIPAWSEEISFDPKEDVRTFDAEGNEEILCGTILPRDVWLCKDGVKFEVLFNNFKQPIGKSGFLFVKFLGEVARTEKYCPIGVIDWRHMSVRFKTDIIVLVRSRFIFDEGEIFNDAVLQHVGKHCRQYRFQLKAQYYKPAKLTRQEIEDKLPPGHSRSSWLSLVKYWYSQKSKELSDIGRQARGFQNHFHTNGSISFANTRADFESENGREPSSFELFEATYKRKDGTYVKDSASAEFVDHATAEIERRIASSSSSKSKVDIQNEVFNECMCDKDKPNQRPLGYGFGVRRKDVFGVHGALRKRSLSTTTRSQGAEIAELKRQNMQTNKLLKTLTSQVGHILGAFRGGRASTGLLDGVESILNEVNDQVAGASTDTTDGSDSEQA